MVSLESDLRRDSGCTEDHAAARSLREETGHYEGRFLLLLGALRIGALRRYNDINQGDHKVIVK